MHNAEHRGGKCVFVVMSGYPDVVLRQIERKRVLGSSESAAGAVQPEQVHQLIRELLLPVEREIYAEQRGVRGLGALHLLDERHELVAQHAEKAVAALHRQPLLVFVEAVVVRIRVRRGEGGEAPVGVDYLLQHRLEGGKIVPLLGLGPDNVALVEQLAVGDVFVHRYALELPQVLLPELHGAPLRACELVHVLGERVEQPFAALAGGELIAHSAEYPQRLAARDVSVPRRAGLPVVVQRAHGVAVGEFLHLEPFQFFPCF